MINLVKNISFLYSIILIFKTLESDQKKFSVIIIILIILTGIMETISIGILIPVIGFFVEPDRYEILLLKYAPFNIDNENLFVFVIFLMLLIFLFKFIFLAYFNYIQGKFIFNYQKYLSSKLYELYLKTDYNFHISTNSSILIRNVITQVNLMTGTLSSSFIFISESIIFIFIFILLIYFNPLATLVVFSTIGLGLTIFYYFTRKALVKYGEKRQLNESSRIKEVQQGLNLIKEIKIYNKEETFINNYNIFNSKVANFGKKIFIISSLPKLWIEFLVIFTFSIICFYYSINSNLILLLPLLTVYAAAAFRLLPSSQRLYNMIQNLKSNQYIIHNVIDEINNHINKKININKLNLKKINQSIQLDKVSFSFPNNNKILLNKLDLSIQKNEFVGIYGESGSGKTTLINLLLGLIKPDNGKIYLDNKEISNYNLFNQIAYVSQKTSLLDDTIKNNITFGVPTNLINISKINNSLKIACLNNFVENLPKNLDTIVGEKNNKISGGQAQRIAIARAIYSNREVIILDEATNAIDADTEEILLQNLKLLKSEKTIIFISHNFKIFDICDSVYHLINGKLQKNK